MLFAPPSTAFSAKSAAETVLRSIRLYNDLRDNDPKYSDDAADDKARCDLAAMLLSTYNIATYYNVVDYLISSGYPKASDEITAFLAMNSDRYARRLLTRHVSPASAYQSDRVKAASTALICLNPYFKSLSWFLDAGRCGPTRSAEPITVNQLRSRIRRKSSYWVPASNTRGNQGAAMAIDPDTGAIFAETVFYEYTHAAGDACYMYKARAWSMWRYANVLAEHGFERCPFEEVPLAELWRDNDHGKEMHGRRWMELALEDFSARAGVVLTPASMMRTLHDLSRARPRTPRSMLMPFRVLPFYPDADKCLKVHVDHPAYREERRSGGVRPHTTIGVMSKILYHALRNDPSLPPLPTDEDLSVEEYA